MKNWTLALAIGTAVTSTVIGTVNPASANFVVGPGGEGEFVEPNWNERFIGVGANKFLIKTFKNAAPNKTYTWKVNVLNDSGVTWTDFHFEILGAQKGTQVYFLDKGGSDNFITGEINLNFTVIDWSNGIVPDDNSALFDDARFTLNIVTGNSFTGNTIEVNQYATPEPLTILGTGVVLGALPVLKKEYAKRNKKKDGDA